MMVTTGLHRDTMQLSRNDIRRCHDEPIDPDGGLARDKSVNRRLRGLREPDVKGANAP